MMVVLRLRRLGVSSSVAVYSPFDEEAFGFFNHDGCSLFEEAIELLKL